VPWRPHPAEGARLEEGQGERVTIEDPQKGPPRSHRAAKGEGSMILQRHRAEAGMSVQSRKHPLECDDFNGMGCLEDLVEKADGQDPRPCLRIPTVTVC
jgi:hypothetical protein